MRVLLKLHTLTIVVADSAADDMAGNKGQQRQMPGPFNSGAQHSLVPGADSGLAGRFYFGPVRYIPAQPVHVFIIDSLGVLHAKFADPAPGGIPPPGTTSGPGPASWPTALLWRGRSLLCCCCHTRDVPPDGFSWLEGQVIHIIGRRSLSHSDILAVGRSAFANT